MWVFALGIMVTITLIRAFASRETGPSRLALWVGMSFAVSIPLGMAYKAGYHYFSPPYLMLWFSILDVVMTWAMVQAALKYRELSWTFWPNAAINMTFIATHMISIFAPSLRLYLAALDVLFIAQLIITNVASTMCGVDIRSLFFRGRGALHSGPLHRSAR